MSITRIAAGGVIWSITIGLGVRVVGLVGTVLVTRYLAPSVIGEVTAASILALTANWIAGFGFGPYVIAKGHENNDGVFHVTVLHLALGALGLLAVVMLADHFTEFFNAPNLGKYLPGMALVVAIKRIGSIPDKLLIRDMRFKLIALTTGAGEITYVVLAVGLVMTTDLGGLAIVIANIAQALLVSTVEVSTVGFRRWLAPKPWNWVRVREIFQFGAPIAVEAILSEGGRQWDKLMFSRLFGAHDTGMYSLAYNLSDIPATYVGEHVATVLFPTMVHIAPQKRNQVFTEACGLLALIVIPMGVGLASVSDTLVAVVLTAEWQGVADFIVVLAAIAIFRPFNSVTSSLLVATGRTKTLMMFEILRAAILFGGMWYLSRFGEVAAASALGVAVTAQFVGTLAILTRQGFPALRLLIELRGPTLAAILMVAIVLLVRHLFSGWPDIHLVIQLIAEIVVGALVYLGGVLLFARHSFNKFVEIIQLQLEKRSSELPDAVDR